jgi:hypothetical protein
MYFLNKGTLASNLGSPNQKSFTAKHESGFSPTPYSLLRQSPTEGDPPAALAPLFPTFKKV